MRRAEPRQMPFVFADSPTGSGHALGAGVPAGRAYLLLTAKALEATGSAAPAADTTQLLEAVASPPNLAEALLRVRSAEPWRDGGREGGVSARTCQ